VEGGCLKLFPQAQTVVRNIKAAEKKNGTTTNISHYSSGEPMTGGVNFPGSGGVFRAFSEGAPLGGVSNLNGSALNAWPQALHFSFLPIWMPRNLYPKEQWTHLTGTKSSAEGAKGEGTGESNSAPDSLNEVASFKGDEENEESSSPPARCDPIGEGGVEPGFISTFLNNGAVF